MINKHSPIPIYHQLLEHIKHQIESGELQTNQMIPSEREYAELYQISRMTVRQALNNLVLQGYLYRKKGRGTFVGNQKIEQTLTGLTSFTEDMTGRGMKPSNVFLDFTITPADYSAAQALHLKEYTPVYEIRRIRLADDLPMAIETTYVPANLLIGLTEDIVHQSLYRHIEQKLGYTIQFAQQEIEASIADKLQANSLQIEYGAPVLCMKRTSYLANGTPFEYVISTYRADRYKFIHELARDADLKRLIYI
ncbi:GntR family transcriptional regulator [Ectobacillus panaciterrae]|uniref:GntR family transcriptional regulator n=1 Tax=Ectobacillus panaciterrae TaxID=363872 RepID=UPI00040A6C68|nr:GntR family transcriptional regulator [Ectobacillus panaciterrae]